MRTDYKSLLTLSSPSIRAVPGANFKSAYVQTQADCRYHIEVVLGLRLIGRVILFSQGLFPMQQITVKDCISPTAPYLSHLLKLDNLPLVCKHVSENVLQHQTSVGVRP